MAESLGTIKGQMVLDIKQALAAYTKVRQKHVATVTALRTGGAAITNVGQTFLGGGLAIAAGIGYAVSAAATFERKLDYFAAITGTTGKEFDNLRDKALQLGTDTIFSADQIADSFVELGKAGVSAKDIIGGVGDGVADLASAADVPLDTAANILLAAVQTFGLSADQAVGVADKLSGAANASMVDVQDLGVSFKYAGGVAHAMGLSFDDTNTALALLGKYGIKGSTAGTSLRQILVSLPGATKKATTQLKDLGIITEDGSNKFFDAQGKIKPLPQIFSTLQKATKGLTQEQKIQAFKTIFQSRALSTALALTNEGSKGFTEMSKAIGKTKAADVSAKRLDNLSGDIEILRGNLDTLAVTVGSKLQGMFRDIVQGVTGVIQAFIDLPDGVQQTIVIVLIVVGALLLLGGIFLIIVGAVLGFVATLFVLGPVISGIIGVVSAIIGGIGAFGGALLAFLGPVGIVIAIIAVIVGALVWFFTQTEVGKVAWQEFCRFLAEAWTNIVNVATDVWGNITSFFSDLWNTIVDAVGGFIGTVVDLFLKFTPQGLIISHWGEIVSFFSDLWNNIVSGVTGFIDFVVQAFVNFPQNVVTVFQNLPALIGYALGFLLGTIVKIFIGIGVFLFQIVPTFIAGVVTNFMKMREQVINWVVQLVVGVVTWWLNLVRTVNTAVGNFITGLITFFRELPGKIIAFIVGLVLGAIQWFQTMRARVIALAVLLVLGVIQFIRELPGKVVAFFTDLVNRVKSTFNRAVGIAKDIAKRVVNGIIDFITGIPGKVKQIFTDAVNGIKDLVGTATKNARKFAAGLWEGFKDGLGINSPSLIEKQMFQITDVTNAETDRLRGQVRTLQSLGKGVNRIGQGIGDEWGSNMGTSLDQLYNTVAATKQLEGELAGGTLASTIGVGGSPTATPTATPTAAAGPTYNVTVNNPTPEKASDSLPRTLRQTAYMVG